jgi:hypothetical protein
LDWLPDFTTSLKPVKAATQLNSKDSLERLIEAEEYSQGFDSNLKEIVRVPIETPYGQRERECLSVKKVKDDFVRLRF